MIIVQQNSIQDSNNKSIETSSRSFISVNSQKKTAASSSSSGSLTPIEEEPCSSIEESVPLQNKMLANLFVPLPDSMLYPSAVSQPSPKSPSECDSCGKSSLVSREQHKSRKSRFHSRLFHLLHHDEEEHSNLSRVEAAEELKEKSKHILSPLFAIFYSARHHRRSLKNEEDSSSKLESKEAAPISFVVPKGISVLDQSASALADEKHSVSSAASAQKASADAAKSQTQSLTKEKRSESPFLDKYSFCSSKIIGKGASGVVRLAKKYETDTIYAVKEFRKKRKSESYREYIKKLTSEFCIGSMLHHVNVIQTIDIIKDGDHWYEIMEYCPGGDLYSVIRDCKLGSDEIDCYFRQLIEGVAYLHSLGVAHRDLKPENLLVNDKGELKITDFGVSEVFRVCWETKCHLSKGLCGSTPYIAPEEFTEKEYDPQQVDVWACGIIYYAMTFHGIPWECASFKDPNYKHFCEHRSMQSEPLVRLPFGPRNLLYKILDPNPSKRLRIADILEDEWFKKINVCCKSENNGRLIVHEHNLSKKA